ncbi:unnamed protein product [Calypogeia fissa]
MTVRLPPGGGAYEGRVGNGRVWGAGRGGGVGRGGHVPILTGVCSWRHPSPGGQEVVPKERAKLEDDSSCPARGPRAGSYAEGDSKIREPIFFIPPVPSGQESSTVRVAKEKENSKYDCFCPGCPTGRKSCPTREQNVESEFLLLSSSSARRPLGPLGQEVGATLPRTTYSTVSARGGNEEKERRKIRFPSSNNSRFSFPMGNKEESTLSARLSVV